MDTHRSKKLGKNSIVIFVSQAIGIGISFIMVPLTLKQLGSSEYGIWITLVGIIEWFNFFDIGLGHGLRNKYAESKAKGELSDLKKYVSTTFFMMLLISISIFILFTSISFFMDWAKILNAPPELKYILRNLSLILIGMFCIRFVVNLISIILTADQNPAIPACLTTFGNLLALLSVLFLIYIDKVNLFNLGLLMSISQVCPLIIAWLIFFKRKYSYLTPKIKYFSKYHLRNIFGFGSRFFLIQITALIMLQSNNLIIANVCGLKDVTNFNIGLKYFNILNIAYMSVLTPLWSASTDAYHRNDTNWLKNIFTKLNRLWYLMIVAAFVMLILAPVVYKIWLGKQFLPDYLLLILIAFNILFLMRGTLYRSFMNGAGKIKLQFYITAIQSVAHIPLAILLGKTYGIYGVVFTMLLWNLINCIWEPIQFRKIIQNKAYGIWDK
ncbi:lipopolysaccharide biosynthesis protein [Elizabethkingia meningoseptica]|uniref:lipopolysaccharide biosynthesis protein n=1 Tax=Elizabethkingia meningoseptica TaxID=238 RepID=UPI0015915D9C|nr:oligosaccharide flippase family protein [Elizabethkingia meningoseptica]